MKIEEIVQYLRTLLQTDVFKEADSSMNGLQVGRPQKEVSKMCFAVDASLDTFKAVADRHADAIFVHHGLFWGEPLAVTKSHYYRLKFLIEHDIALLAAHLPLDAHPTVGNNAVMAKRLGIVNPDPFGMYHGLAIGYKGMLPKAMTAEEICMILEISPATGLRILPFGPKLIKSIGIVSGGAPFEVLQAIDQELDCYITGEPGHSVYAQCFEAGITMICGGHYATEVFGPRQLAQTVAEELGIQTEFLALPTAL